MFHWLKALVCENRVMMMIIIWTNRQTNRQGCRQAGTGSLAVSVALPRHPLHSGMKHSLLPRPGSTQLPHYNQGVPNRDTMCVYVCVCVFLLVISNETDYGVRSCCDTHGTQHHHSHSITEGNSFCCMAF